MFLKGILRPQGRKRQQGLEYTPKKHKIVQILLRTIENNRANTGEKLIASPKRVNVEHIYPQSPVAGARWVDHTEQVYRLGNLTLLSAPLNQQQQNLPFPQKKSNYQMSTFAITKELFDLDVWTQGDIARRQEMLAVEAANIWPVALI